METHQGLMDSKVIELNEKASTERGTPTSFVSKLK